MDLFEEWLSKKDSNKNIKTALTDSSFRNYCQKHKEEEFEEKNNDLSTYGDAVIRLGYVDILFGKVDKLSEVKAKYESDRFLVEHVAKHYNLLEHIRFDKEDSNIVQSYDYKELGEKLKYIATAVEAMIGAIYIETDKDMASITKLLKTWMEF